MIIEMRRYAILPGRMNDMHARMTEMLLPLFQTHGVPTPLAIWENRADTSILTWLLEWNGFDERQATWAAFRPVWEAARQSRGGDEFVTRTDLTLIAPWPEAPLSFGQDGAGCESAWIVQPRVGHGAVFRRTCLEGGFASFVEAGASGVAACDFLFGPLPRSLVLASWPDAGTRDRGLAELARRPAPLNLLGALGADPKLSDAGSWEKLDRATYLEPRPPSTR
jgi:hypothetical protein